MQYGHQWLTFEFYLCFQPNGPSSAVLRELVLRYVHEFPRRKRLLDVNLLDDVVRLLKLAAKVVVITGAGVSVKILSILLYFCKIFCL